MNPIVNYHLRLYDCPVSTPTIFVFSFEDKVVIGGSGPSVKSLIKKYCKVYSEKGDYLYGYIENKVEDVLDSLSGFKIVCGGTVKDLIRKRGLDFVSLASFVTSYLFFKDDEEKLFSFASLLDRILDDINQSLNKYDISEDYKFFSDSRKIVVRRANGDTSVDVGGLKIDLDSDKRYVIFATYDEVNVDGDIIGVFEDEREFAKFFVENFGDLEGLSLFMDDKEIRDVYPLLVSKDLDVVKRQIDVYYKSNSEYYTKYLQMLFPGFNYSLTVRHADLFFLHFVYDFIFSFAKYNQDTDRKDFLGLLSSVYKKYVEKVFKSGESLRYRKSDILSVVDSLNSVLINDDVLYNKFISFFKDKVENVLREIVEPHDMDSKVYRHFVRVVKMFNNFVNDIMTDEDYDFVISFIKDNLNHAFVYSGDDVRRVLAANKLLTEEKEGYLTGIKVLKLSRLISGYIIYLLCVSMSASSLYDLSPDRKSKSVKVFVKSYSSILAFLSLIDNAKHYGTYLSLSIVLFIVSYYVNNQDIVRNGKLYIPINDNKVVELDVSLIEKILSILSKSDVNVKKVDVKNLDRYHSSLCNYYPFYGMVSYYYDYLNERATFFKLSLFPHQERAVSKILSGYIDGNDGFLLSHSTGSGKTITIAKNMADLINYRKSQGVDTKVLFISKNEIIEKVSREIVYFLPEGYFYIVDSIKDIDDIYNNNRYPDILAISFRMLSLYLSEDIENSGVDLFRSGDVNQSLSSKNEQQDNVNEDNQSDGFRISEDDNSDDMASYIKSKLSKRKKQKSDSSSYLNEEKIIKLFSNYNIIYIDEAHYVKNVYVVDADVNGYSFMKRNYETYYNRYPDISKYNMYYVDNVSKIGAIILYIFLDYVRKKYIEGVYIPESERKFFVLSTGTVFSNYPHESWSLFYLTGAYYREGDNKMIRDYLADVVSFAKLFVDKGDKRYDDFFNVLRSSGEMLGVDDIIEIMNEYMPGIKDKNVIFKNIVTLLSNKNYLDIYTEEEAVKDGLLSQPIRKMVKVPIKTAVDDITRSNLSNLSANYDLIENVESLMENIKEVFSIYANNLGMKKNVKYLFEDTGGKFLKMMNSMMDNTSHNYSFVSEIIDEFLRSNGLDVTNKKKLLEAYYNTLRGLRTYLKLKGENGDIVLDIPYDYDIIITDNVLNKVEKIKFKINKVAENIVKVVNTLLSLFNTVNYNHLMLSSYDFLKFMYYDMIMKWVKCDNGIIPGTGKTFIVVEHVKWARYLFYSIAEFIYNVMTSVKNDTPIDLGEVIRTSVDNYLDSVLANICVSGSINNIEPTYYAFFVRNMNDIVNELLNIKMTIESIGGNHISTQDLEKIVTSLYKVILSNRNIAFLASLVNSNISDNSRYVDEYYLSYLYNKYGKDFFTFGRYFNAYFGGLSIRNENDSMALLKSISGEKLKVYNNHETVFDYLKHLNLISDHVYANMFSIRKSIKSKSEALFSNNKGDFHDMLIRKVFKMRSDSGVGKVKMALSDNFMSNPEMRVILSNARSVAEGLNFKGGNAMYILDFGHSIGLLSQIEARLNRLGTNVPIEIYYVFSDLRQDYNKIKGLFIKDFSSYYSGFNSKGIYYSLIQSPFDPVYYISRDSIRKTFSDIE
ncbi:MAG: DEAD/DEAH box helicase family protein, partial [Candidatus Methanomethylicia archaeon]